eukprot:CAMPEP_0172927096 /NCGR_PEP_ID=MMETSP1075-20121228/216872_1 /TAXON_ID=2916 /ORGANISM="Ceratium fusus, Strain PA161109" /LENGTH=113 /DNA_ID=CAMNT_0013788299 /DNA_START=534 /DNA_END=876 /DNA_ORIENTATION=-
MANGTTITSFCAMSCLVDASVPLKRARGPVMLRDIGIASPKPSWFKPSTAALISASMSKPHFVASSQLSMLSGRVTSASMLTKTGLVPQTALLLTPHIGSGQSNSSSHVDARY